MVNMYIYMVVGFLAGIITALVIYAIIKSKREPFKSKNLADHLPVSILIYKNIENQLIYANKEALKLFNLNVRSKLQNRFSKDIIPSIAPLNTTKTLKKNEIVLNGKNDTKVHVVNIPFRINSRCYGQLLIDISSYKENELKIKKSREIAEKANRIKSMFLANMSHEIRTPMNAIIGISNMLLQYKNKNLTEKQKEGIELIHSSGNRLLNLINEILDLSKIEAGKMTITNKKVVLSNLFAQLKALVYSLISDKNIKFYVKKSHLLPESIITDGNKLNQILINILGNSVKFTEEGLIVLNMHLIGNEVVFEITDTGRGIKKEELPYIFDEFRQISNNDDSSSKHDGNSTGLGLALSKKLVNLMGGIISAKSEFNVGTTVSFSIPFQPVKAEKIHVDKRENESLKSKPAIAAPKADALVIDSDYGAFYLMEHYLQSYNCNVYHANTSTKGLQLVESVDPAIIFLELDLPTYSGYDILRRLQNEENKGKRYIIIHSSRNMPPHNKYQYYRYLKKPIDDTEIKELLDGIFSEINKGYKKKILLVEDDEPNVYTIKMMLGNKYELITASNGKEGVEKYKETMPDLVLMDIKMPIMDGIEALKEIKKSDRSTPVIAVTARVMAFEKLEIMASGFDDFIAKPIIHEKLLNLISQHV